MQRVQIGHRLYACLQDGTKFGESNSGYIDHGGGLVVDTFYDLPRTRAMMTSFTEVAPSAAAPRRLINTHHNGDHCWGNQVLAEVGTEIIGHELCARYFLKEASPELFVSLQEAESLPPHLAGLAASLRGFDFRDITLTPPTTLLHDDVVLDLDGTIVEFRYLGPAHTAGDTVVWLPAEGVLFTGDLLFNECTPIGWEGTFAGWITALNTMISWEPEVVVPGHGPVCGAEALTGMRDYLAYVRDEATAHHAAGRSVVDAAKRIDLGPFSHWAEPERLASQLHRAYRELDGVAWDTKVDTMAVFADMAAIHRASNP